MQLQEVRRAARRHELALGRLVVDRRDQPALVDDDPHLVVLQPGSAGRHAQAGHPVDRVGPRVGGELAVAGPDEQHERVRDHPFQLVGDAGVLALGLPVHPRDRRAGQDVVELLQQHGLPAVAQRLGRVVGARPDGRGGGPQLGLAQQVLAAPVAALRARLRGVGAAVVLQVQLARPHRRVRVLGGRGGEELRRTGEAHGAASPPGRACGARRPASPGWARRRRRPSRTAPATCWPAPSPRTAAAHAPAPRPTAPRCRCRPAGSACGSGCRRCPPSRRCGAGSGWCRSS